MSRSVHNITSDESSLKRENSLPTYEEATGRVQPTVPSLVAVQPSAAINNVNERVTYYDNLIPVHQPHNRPHTPPRTIRDVETGLQQSAQRVVQHEDPVVRQMAQTVLTECERARRKRESKQTAQCIGLILGIFLALILFAVRMANSSKSSYHRHNWN